MLLSNFALLNVVWLFILAVDINEAGSLCSALGNVSPCLCERLQTSDIQWDTAVECHQLGSASELFDIGRSLKDSVIDSFNIFASKIEYLPSNVFLHANIRRLQIYDTPISHFTEGKETAFLGLEKVLEELTMRRCEITHHAKIERLENLSVLTSLDLSYNQIVNISAKWFKIPPRKLVVLVLKGNHIESIESQAFAFLTELRVLDLSENRLSTVTRNMLPWPSTHLQFLYLSYNQIETLPNDFLFNMPILKRLYLDHNRLSILSSAVFENVWKTNNLLQHVDFLGNDILCDETLCWISFYENDNIVTGSCADPDELRGRRIRSLWPWELHCNESRYHGGLHLAYRPRM